MSARENILQRLRAAPRGVALPPPDVPAFHAALTAGRPASTRAQRIALFCQQMAFWRGEVLWVTRHDWVEKLRQSCAEKGVRSLLYGEHGEHAAALRTAGIAGLRPYDRPVEEWKNELFANVDAGFTATRGAIAETGTLILWPHADEPRLLSLVPPIHFALLDAAQIHDTLFQAMTVQAWQGGMPTNVVLVSGPSKTADIQVTLAYGAHGPKELVVLLLVDETERP